MNKGNIMKLSDEEKHIIDTIAYAALIDELERAGTIPKEVYYEMYESFTEKQRMVVSSFNFLSTNK